MAQQRKVAVVVDSSSCLPPHIIKQWDINVVPHELVIGGQTFMDCIDIVPSEFYSILGNTRHVPTTSAPSPATFLNVFHQASTTARSILCITVSSNFSATYESANIAVRIAQEQLPHINISVLDSRAAAGAEGLIALEASRQASNGKSLEKVHRTAKELIPRVAMLAFLDTLHYLGKSGRIPKIKAWAGSILGIKPLTEMTLGEARLLEKPRSRGKATQRIVEIMKERIGNNPAHINIMHAQANTDAERLRLVIGQEFHCSELLISEFTPVMGAHTGPGLLGVAFYAQDQETQHATA